jgi:beta-N-acetylhexosaminidase
MRGVGVRWDEDPAAARDHAFAIGSTIARELRAHGVDFSFTPVLDLDHGASAIIGDRAFHREPAVVGELAGALVRGLHAGGSAAVGKHFPGHGYVAADSHLELPVDDRPLEAVLERDIAPFASLAGTLDAVMPGHVVYPRVDPRPAGFSSVWVGDILRARLGFDGLVVSDDLEMGAAQGVGDIVARADAAVAAGCDMVLVCNRFDAMDDLLARWSPPENARLADRMAAMAAREIASDAAKS